MRLRAMAGQFWKLARDTASECWTDNVSRLSAALAYYTVFAVAPLLVIGVKLAGLFFGRQRSQQEVNHRLEQLLGNEAAKAVQSLLNRAAAAHATGTWSAIISLIFLFYVSMALFSELQDAMNTIWEVKAGPHRTWKQRVLNRVWPFAMVMSVGVLLLISVATEPLLAKFTPRWGGPHWVHATLRIGTLLVVFSVVFGILFRVLPDVSIRWSDVAIGSITTAVFFTTGELLLQWYLDRPGLLSIYGTAGSMAILLLWVYYSAHVLFFGAEFTQVYARQSGHRVQPTRGAVQFHRQTDQQPPESAGEGST